MSPLIKYLKALNEKNIWDIIDKNIGGSDDTKYNNNNDNINQIMTSYC